MNRRKLIKVTSDILRDSLWDISMWSNFSSQNLMQQAKFLFLSETSMHRQAFRLYCTILRSRFREKSLLNPFEYKRSPVSLFFCFLIKSEISKVVQHFYFLKNFIFIDLSPTCKTPLISLLLRSFMLSFISLNHACTYFLPFAWVALFLSWADTQDRITAILSGSRKTD